MKTLLSRTPWWLHWAALLALAAAYAVVVVRAYAGMPAGEAGGWTPARVFVQVLVDGIPALLAVFALGLVVTIAQQRAEAGALSRPVRRLLYWTPRAALLAFAAFVSIFALDVFGAGYGFWETLLALFMHLIPVFLLLAAAAAAWRWPWIGAVVLFGWTLLYVGTFRGFFLSVYVSLALLPFLLGVLFLLNWMFRAELRTGGSHTPPRPRSPDAHRARMARVARSAPLAYR